MSLSGTKSDACYNFFQRKVYNTLYKYDVKIYQTVLKFQALFYYLQFALATYGQMFI